MFRVAMSLARALAAAASASFLLSGCVGMGAFGPVGLNASGYRSIKDDPLPEPATAAPSPAPKPARAKTAIVAPPPAKPKPRPQPAARSDVPTCDNNKACMAQLKALIDDPARSWIGQVPGPAEYAAGTRLFAYRALQAQLTCAQLTSALNEIVGAAKAFRARVPGVTSQQARRVLALGADVERELRAEFSNRCRS